MITGIRPGHVYYDEASDVNPTLYRGIPIRMVDTIQTKIPTEMWRTLNSGAFSMPTTKPKKLTKDQQIAAHNMTISNLQAQLDQARSSLQDKTSDYNNLCQRMLDLQTEAKHLRKTNAKLIKKLTRKS